MTRKVHLFHGQSYQEYGPGTEEHEKWYQMTLHEFNLLIIEFVKQGITLYYNAIDRVFVVEDHVFI